MSALKERAVPMSRLLAGRGFAWAGLGMGSTLLQAVAENLLAVVLILFLFSFGLVDRSRMPHWLPAAWAHMDPVTVLAILVAVGLLRGLFQLLASQAFHALLELVRARFHMIQSYRMLVSEQEVSFSLSDANLMMGEYITKASDYVYQTAQLLAGLALSLSFLAGMLWLAWKEALLGLACLAILSPTIWWLNRAIGRVSVNLPEQRGVLGRALVRICKNRLLIHVMRLQRQELAHFLRAVVAYFHFSRRTFFLRDIATVLPPMLGIVSIVLMVGASIAFFHTQPIELVAFVYLFVGFSRNVAAITNQTGTISQYRCQFDEAVRLLASLTPRQIVEAYRPDQALGFYHHPVQKDSARTGGGANLILPPVPPEIQIRGVCFTWPGASQPVFENFDLHIPAGLQFGVIGPNGCGKSTLLGLILGIISPQVGEVLIDGLPAREYLRVGGPVGYVGADNLLILGSVRDNLLYGLERPAGSSEIWGALARVGLDDWVRSLPAGLDYMISENEEGLSSGQRQRLALARAFLRRPALLILDEASANLDVSAEAELAEVLGSMTGRCTTIIVSHKPGLLAGAGRVFRLEEPVNV